MKIYKTPFIFVLFLTHLFSQPVASFSADAISIASSTEQNSFSEAVVISNSGSEDLSWSLEVSGDSIYYVSHMKGLWRQALMILFLLQGPMIFIWWIYESRLRFITNDPGNIIVDINVTVDLTGVAVTILNSDSLDFGGVIALASKVLSRQVYNDGDDDLVLSLSTETSVFQPVSNSIVLAPQEAGDINVAFAPDDVGIFSDTLTIETNDTGNAVVKIALIGEGLTPPDIEVDLTEAYFDISTGEIDTISATITNSGGTALETTIAVTYFDENGDTLETNVRFAKADYADPSLEENQDRITENVWLTRGTTERFIMLLLRMKMTDTLVRLAQVGGLVLYPKLTAQMMLIGKA